MSIIPVDIQDSAGHFTTLEVPLDMLLSEVATLACEALQLPLRDRLGQTLTYALFHHRLARFLNLDLNLQGHQIRAGDRLRILPKAFSEFFELELHSDPTPGMLFPLLPKEMSIGREFNNQIVIRHKSVSRQHGIFTWQDGFHLYLDVGSANGSLINNRPVTELTPLAGGDLLTIGQAVLLYRERERQDTSAETETLASAGVSNEQSRTGLMQIPRSQVYLSYSSGQRDVAESLIEHLGKTGIKVYYDSENVLGVMQRADVMIVILSREAVANAQLVRQWDEFYTLRKPIIAVLFEPCRVPDSVDDVGQYVEYHYDDYALAGDVLEVLQKIK
jgi:pSer/pThr/pTyr-binding forkhead associated (FHA) protein